MAPPVGDPKWYPPEQEDLINRCPIENTYTYRKKHGTLPGQNQQNTENNKDNHSAIFKWSIFNGWNVPVEKEIIPSWDVFTKLFELNDKIVNYQYNQLSELLEIWNNKLIDLGGDPTQFDWSNFRPLRLSREEDWSDWLAHLISTSQVGELSASLLNIEEFSTEAYCLPTNVYREISHDGYRADIIIEWQNHSYTHIEVKIGDPNLAKTLETGNALQEKYDISDDHWNNYILLLSNQLNDWYNLPEHLTKPVIAITWEDVAISIRKALKSDELITWKVWAYTFLGAIEQILIGFPGHLIASKPHRNIETKIEILTKGLINE